jgi:hypothetical protein
MKKLFLKSAAILFISTLFVSTGYAQKVNGNGKLIEKSRSVGSFNGVGVSGSFDVFLVEGNEGKIELSVEENLEQYLITEVKNGTLQIKWEKGVNIRTTKDTKVTVHFNKLNSVALAGSGDVVSKDRISTDHLDVALAGSGDIKLEVSAQKLEAAISGSGDIELSGKATEFEGAVAGSGDVEAYDLASEKADLKISGSGTIQCNVEKEIVARISGSGDIKYKGSPRIEDVKVSGSGSVRSY